MFRRPRRAGGQRSHHAVGLSEILEFLMAEVMGWAWQAHEAGPVGRRAAALEKGAAGALDHWDCLFRLRLYRQALPLLFRGSAYNLGFDVALPIHSGNHAANRVRMNRSRPALQSTPQRNRTSSALPSTHMSPSRYCTSTQPLLWQGDSQAPSTRTCLSSSRCCETFHPYTIR